MLCYMYKERYEWVAYEGSLTGDQWADPTEYGIMKSRSNEG